MSLASLQPPLAKLLSNLPGRPFEQTQLDELVKKVLEETKDVSSSENRKSQWEYLLKNEVFDLAATEGQALKNEDTTYYDQLQDILDVVLTFTEQDACDQSFPFSVLQDLLEAQTIASCSHIFGWIEARSARLTEGMVPQKGKALVLLRTLNDLLRRLSKMGNMTIFCGRILTFLSGVFPLGERSGVNLRGEYGPTWEIVNIEHREEAPGEEADDEETKKLKNANKLAEQKIDFYNTFWSLQLPFSKPAHFVNPTAFPEFKTAVGKVLPVLKEANAKERLMMGSKAVASSNGSLKRKRDVESNDETVEEYFFAKFLTSPDLLDLEVADTHFRRQFLLQLLILLSHLLNFTKTAKAAWQTTRNRSLQIDFTLQDADAQWVQETYNKAMEELRQTSPNGRVFAETAAVILERDKNWVRWKNEMCLPFDKEPWSLEIEVEEEVDGHVVKKKRKVGLEEATRDARQKLRESPEEWPWKYGTEPLTEIWEMGYRDLDDLQRPFHPGDIKDFVKKVELEDRRIELRTKTLRKQQEKREAIKAAAAAQAAAAAKAEAETKQSDGPSSTPPEVKPTIIQTSASPLHPSLPAKPTTDTDIKMQDVSTPPATSSPAPSAPTVTTPTPAPTAPPPLPPDDQITRSEESKQRWAWLALRTARDQHLSHFGKIGTGDIQALAREIEKEREEKEKEKEKAGGLSAESPMVLASSPTKSPAPEMKKVDSEGDVKMEEQ